ncbi:MAG TPA: hypothetical protein VHV10_01075 [Ktedonobacteraceae bacterium]|nr:hypothetical protein [Ktedonobacteraceae bacterium]
MAWCRFFVPKIASPRIKPGDPDLNEHISYAKCIKGHVLKDANDWVCCENLPAADAKCWQEGGETLFTLRQRTNTIAKKTEADTAKPEARNNATTQKVAP